jgi:hypothetical protein
MLLEVRLGPKIFVPLNAARIYLTGRQIVGIQAEGYQLQLFFPMDCFFLGHSLTHRVSLLHRLCV